MSLRELSFDIGFKGNATDVLKVNKSVDNLKSSSIKAGFGMDELASKIGTSSSKAVNSIKKIGSSLDDLTKGKLYKVGSIGKSTFNSMKIYVDGVYRSSDRLSGKLNNVSSKLSSISKKSGHIGRVFSIGVTAPLTVAGKKIINSFSDFSSGMSEVKAISGASNIEFDQLSKKAKHMGATTKFSATESAKALKYMAMAGWDTNKMLSGLDGVMNLAAASGEELGTVSDIVTDAMTAFGMSADKSTKFADVLAQASSKSNTSVGIMGETFKYVAPVAGALKYSIEDTAIAVGLMANAGIKGSQAGTALRGAMSNMVKPTKEMQNAMDKLGISITDSSGKTKPFKNVMDSMRSGFSKLSDSQKAYYANVLFGDTAMSGMLGIINETDENYKKLTKSIYNASGASKRQSDIMQDNLSGDFVKFKSALEGVSIQIGEILVPHLRKGTQFLTKLATKFSELDTKTKTSIIKLALFTTAIGPMFMGIRMATSGLSIFTGVLGFLAKNNAFLLISKGFTYIGKSLMFTLGILGKLKSAVLLIKTFGLKGMLIAFKPAIIAIGTSMLPIIVTIGLLVAAGYLLYKNWNLLKSKGIEFVNSLKGQFTSFVSTVQGLWENLKVIFLALLPVFSGVLGSMLGGIGSFIKTLVVAVGGIIKIFKGITDFLVGVFTGNWQQAWDGILGIFTGIIDTIKSIFGGVIDFFGGVIKGFKEGIGLGNSTVDKVKNGDKNKKPIGGYLPEFAKGVENFGGGLAIVGEKGPELVNLPAGSSVKSNSETMDIFKNSRKFLDLTTSNTNTHNRYNNSKVTTSNNDNKIIHFAPQINVTTSSDKAEETAELTKNKIKALFEELIEDEELIS